VLHAVALHARVEQIAYRFDHGIRHGDMKLAAAALEFDLERVDHHHFRWADDIGEMRIDLRIEVLDGDRAADAPGLGQVGKRLAQHHLHDASFSLGEFAALDLGVAAIAAKKI